MTPGDIQRYSSRTHRLDQTMLARHLQNATRYYRIAGYFTSSLFEIAAEHLEGVPDVRIVCNSDVRAEDIKIARVREASLLGRLNSQAVEVDSLLNKPRYQWLYEFLTRHPDAIRVAPDEFCGFVHGKAGVIWKKDGSRLGFIGSMNETRSGWQKHYEILWEDHSPEGIDWIEAEFEALWAKAVPLPRVVAQELGRRAWRVEIELGQEEDDHSLAPAALVEAPMYREGLCLQPWQRAFVTECVKHRGWFGAVRLLLADEVGLGKTLSMGTAALTLALLDADKTESSGNSCRLRPIAIFAPASLTEQWQTEMMDKLGIPCARWDSRKKVWLDPQGLFISPPGAEQIGRCPFRIGIISTGLIVQPTTEKELLSQINFDILVLDESHKARTRQALGRNEGEPNALLKFMRDAAGRSRHVLLGTATPMQTRVEDLWGQLAILHRGDGRFVLGNEFSPWHIPAQARPLLTGEDHPRDLEQAWKFLRPPLPPVDASSEGYFRRLVHNIRAEMGLRENTFEATGSVVDLPEAVREEFEDLLEEPVQGTKFFQRHNPVVRHVVLRKRRVLEESGLLQRIGVDLHPDHDRSREPHQFAALFQEQALKTEHWFDQAYEAAEAFGRAYGRRVGGAGFMKTLMTQRLCSSCIAGLSTAQKILQGGEIEDQDGESLKNLDEITAEEKGWLNKLIQALSQMRDQDPKLKAVKHYLVEEDWLRYGCIIFSQYYDTASWVAYNLAAMFPDELVGLYAGAGKSALYRGPDNQNEAEREHLKNLVQEQDVSIMVATDAACEGLNLQRLGTLINVDLPWNPTRLEQRIGRIKRFGQVRASVDMLNLVYKDTLDEKIYARLSERMKDRFDILGSLPDTIVDEWIENEELIGAKMDEYIEAQKRVNGFDIRYNSNLDAREDDWRNCTRVLSLRRIDSFMRQGWGTKSPAGEG
ncbi:phospholipase D-like domain-containing anti-phage protein [Desulfonatronospira sp.]|uniref:phospholipase D-like domain-containing anti-phage protein n=1 Tax=Desulfonatronospira sp. TaxID=1962951 RepID=UPI0025BD9202|nr:phospholipase D-like domain-containing anti-phage protein [Desulfonatronospira sp.]